MSGERGLEVAAVARRARAAVDATTVVFRPVRAGNAFEETVERLLAAIRLGIVTEGNRLPAERDLAARLEVSRMTLREAIRALQIAGYVECRRGRHGGTFVVDRLEHHTGDLPRPSSPGREGLADVLVLREVVEVGAAAFAARRPVTDAVRAHLRERLAQCSGATASSYRRADSRLHLAIAEATGSASVVAAVADVRVRLNDLLDEACFEPASVERSNAEHAAVVEAIVSGDVEGARAAMAAHLGATAALLRGVLG